MARSVLRLLSSYPLLTLVFLFLQSSDALWTPRRPTSFGARGAKALKASCALDGSGDASPTTEVSSRRSCSMSTTTTTTTTAAAAAASTTTSEDCSKRVCDRNGAVRGEGWRRKRECGGGGALSDGAATGVGGARGGGGLERRPRRQVPPGGVPGRVIPAAGRDRAATGILLGRERLRAGGGAHGHHRQGLRRMAHRAHGPRARQRGARRQTRAKAGAEIGRQCRSRHLGRVPSNFFAFGEYSLAQRSLAVAKPVPNLRGGRRVGLRRLRLRGGPLVAAPARRGPTPPRPCLCWGPRCTGACSS